MRTPVTAARAGHLHVLLRGSLIILLFLTAAGSVAPAQGIITTIAGNGRYFKGDGGPALSAQMGQLSGVSADAAGNVYASDPTNSIIIKVSVSGAITRIAGNNIAGYSGDGGPATSASLNNPQGLKVDPAGNSFVADTNNQRIRKIAPDGTISTVAGNGTNGFSGDGGPATEAQFSTPTNVTVDPAGSLFISDTGNVRVRKVSPEGIITTFAGNGTSAFSGDGGPAIEASLGRTRGLDIDQAGNLYVGDAPARVRKISPDGIISTIAGNGQQGAPAGDGGPAVNAVVPFPNYLCVDLDGNVYISSGGGSIRRVDSKGIITTVAAGGSGADGVAALTGGVAGPQGVAFAAGSLYIAESAVGRIRRINPAGIINTIAGTSLANYAGDNGPGASAQLSLPNGLAVDSKGNVYVADTYNNRIRRIATDGRITTVAGSGRVGFAGDGGQATNATLNSPRGVTLDAAGNIYVSDTNNNRVRKVTPQGVITTIAGNGQNNFSGDGGPATSAGLQQPSGLVLDAAGNIFVAAQGQSRIRKITPAGIITTVAGNGTVGFAGDGGPATSASLNFPTSVAVDSAGSLFIMDATNLRLRKVTPDGVISTFAVILGSAVTIDQDGTLYVTGTFLHRVKKLSPDGTSIAIAGREGDPLGGGIPGFAGDGGQAKDALLNAAAGIALDSSGNLYISDTNNDRIRKILAGRPTISAGPATVSFTANVGADVFPKQVTVASPVSLLPWSATTSGGEWLSISPPSGTTPANINVSINTSGLAPGSYRGSITVTAPDADPQTQTVAVTLAVTAVNPPRLSVQSPGISFALNTGSATGTNQFAVVNAGSGSLDFTATTTTDTGGRWLSVSPASGTVTAATPGTLTATANPSGLNAGTYTGKIVVASASTGQSITVPVTMTIAGVRQSMLLSQTGLTYTTVAGAGAVPSQSFGILNTKQGQMNWTVVTSTLSGGANWLSANPSSGASEANSLKVPLVNVAVNPAGLAAGEYYGQVRVSAPGADNSPQLVSVVLRVLPAGSNPPPLVRPTGLIFTSISGTSPPGSQNVSVANLTATPVTFSSGRLTLDGKDWFVSIPPSETVTPGTPTRLTVQTDTTSLTPGIRRGALTLLFSDGNIQTVNLLSVLLGAGGSKDLRSAGGCTPAALLPLVTSFGPNFNVSAGWPSPIEAKVVDDCGTPMETGSVVAAFSNGDPPVTLVRLGEGNWSGTWQPRNAAQAGVTITVTAQIPEQKLKGSAQVTGGLQAASNVPVVGQAALVNAASFGPLALVSPGSMITIFGSKLADAAAAATSLPLPTQLGGVSVVMGGQLLPLIYVSAGQVNAVVPYGVTVNAQQQVVVRKGTSYSVPEPVTVAQAQPAIFTRDQSGQGQGLIVKGAGIADAANPVQAGDVVVAYGTGFGDVSPAVASGVAAPVSPLSRTVVAVEARVGGQVAPVSFAGLVPGFVGLYQVNVQIPAGVAAGASVPFVLVQGGTPSNSVTIAVK